jgi:hypothetical protein
MNESSFDGTITDRGIYAECGENIYTETSDDDDKLAAVANTDVATQAWYAGQ